MFDDNETRYAEAPIQLFQSLASLDLKQFEPTVSNLGDIVKSPSPAKVTHAPLQPSLPRRVLGNTAELLVQCLEQEGVRHVFGQCAEATSLIGQALQKSPIQFIPTCHSRGAASMAHVYSRLTGRVGVCLAKSGQNILELLPGAIEATLHEVPMVVITEQAIADDLSLESREDLDLIGIFGPGLKWSQQIDCPERTPEIIHNAFHQARTETKAGQPGAVYINLLETIALMPTSEHLIEGNLSRKPVPLPQGVEQAATWISKTLTPLISDSGGAVQSKVQKTFIDKPVTSLLKLRSQIRANSEQNDKDTHIPFKPQTLIQTVRAVLHPQDILLSDTGIHRKWLIHAYTGELPNTCLTFQESSSAGLAISGAIAAKLIQPKRSVLSLISVDGFMGHYPELESTRWLKAPFVTLICNPGGWYPNFVEIAKSMGFQGYRITSSESLMPILKTALAQDSPAIIDCPVDYREETV